jgi:hypothetical protein
MTTKVSNQFAQYEEEVDVQATKGLIYNVWHVLVYGVVASVFIVKLFAVFARKITKESLED